MCSLKQPDPYVLNSGNEKDFFPEIQVTKEIEIPKCGKVNEKEEPVVFILWGNFAKEKKKFNETKFANFT